MQQKLYFSISCVGISNFIYISFCKKRSKLPSWPSSILVVDCISTLLYKGFGTLVFESFSTFGCESFCTFVFTWIFLDFVPFLWLSLSKPKAGVVYCVRMIHNLFWSVRVVWWSILIVLIDVMVTWFSFHLMLFRSRMIFRCLQTSRVFAYLRKIVLHWHLWLQLLSC